MMVVCAKQPFFAARRVRDEPCDESAQNESSESKTWWLDIL